MGVFNKFKDLMGFEEYEEEDEMEMEEEDYGTERKSVDTRQPLTSQPRYDNNVVSMQNRTVKALTSKFKLMVIEPKGFDECSKLVDSLKSRKPIIVNLETVSYTHLDAKVYREVFI